MLFRKSEFMPNTQKKKIIATIISVAKKKQKHIVLVESEDDRVLQAAAKITKQKIAIITLIGNPTQITKRAKKLKISLAKITLIDIKNPPTNYTSSLVQIRKKKGLTAQQAKTLLQEPIYYATMMVKKGHADGLVSGAAHPTAHTFRPALQIIKTRPGIKTASSYFLMALQKQTLFFADCGLNINPDAKQLAEIAVATGHSAKEFGFKPKIALLSCSTKGSATHDIIEKVVQATKLAKKLDPKLTIDGELQADAALVAHVAKSKAPGSAIKGDANVLVFPDLNSGNIAYKLVERLAGATAIGPITQGLAKPVNDLSRGCSVEDIVEVVAITALQAK